MGSKENSSKFIWPSVHLCEMSSIFLAQRANSHANYGCVYAKKVVVVEVVAFFCILLLLSESPSFTHIVGIFFIRQTESLSCLSVSLDKHIRQINTLGYVYTNIKDAYRFRSRPHFGQSDQPHTNPCTSCVFESIRMAVHNALLS